MALEISKGHTVGDIVLGDKGNYRSLAPREIFPVLSPNGIIGETRRKYPRILTRPGTCKHYNVSPKNLTEGVCRRYPPTPMLLAVAGRPGVFGIKSHWPAMGHKDNCGEWTVKGSLLQ